MPRDTLHTAVRPARMSSSIPAGRAYFNPCASHHKAKAPAPEYSQETPFQYRNGRGAYAAQPFFGRAAGPNDEFYPPRATRPGMTWDEYGKRWDGAD